MRVCDVQINKTEGVYKEPAARVADVLEDKLEIGVNKTVKRGKAGCDGVQ